jgi:CO/xanthine dehydrogenase Mo-binding subunit
MSKADQIMPAPLTNVQFRQVGKRLTRTDAPGKANGRTPFAGDYVMPGMLHARVVRANLASARLACLDVSKARALKGVACILTAADLPDRTAATDIPGQTGQKRLDTGQQILVRERVRYFGEPLALIAAAAAQAVAECSPIDDIRASADYRRHTVEALTRRLVSRAWQELC